jgi:hypothetical protein
MTDDVKDESQPEEKPKRRYQRSSHERAKLLERRRLKAAEKATKESLKAAKNVALKKKRIADLKKKRAELTTNTIKKIEDPKAPKLVTEEELEHSQTLKNAVDNGDVEVAFQPFPGPQYRFLAAPETEVLYGGAAGGGKSFAMLMDPLRYADNANHRALLLRKSMPELLELIDKSKQLYLKVYPKARYSETNKRWTFPSGATLQFSYIDVESDVYRFQGQSFTWIGIDEITHYATPYVWDYLRSRLRRTDLSITPYMRCTANPGGVGGWWVKKMFIEPSPPNTPFWATDIETGLTLRYPDVLGVAEDLRGTPLFKRKFIPARLTDNPALMASPEYMAMLSSLPETQRRRLLEGDWDVSDDCAFPEFRKDLHTIEPFEIPSSWHRFRACDYGYVAHTAVLWLALDPKGRVFVYRELYAKNLNAEDLAYKILLMEEDESKPLTGFLDSNCWERRGQIGPSIAETMINKGVKWVPASKGPGSRVNGKLELHRLLATDYITHTPNLMIMQSCPNLIRTLPALPLDKNNPEDVDTHFPEDHLYDALRYGVMSRQIDRHQQYNRYIDEQPDVFDQVFGY